MSYHTNVTMNGFHQEAFSLTMNLSGTVTAADVGKAVALDTTAPNTAKLAGADDHIIGRLQSVENRTNEGTVVGAVEFKFSLRIPIQTGETVNVGDTVVGGLSGAVKAATTPDYNSNFVAEVIPAAGGKPAYAVVTKF